MTRVSPELVLVDPALREAALAALPPPGDCLATKRPAAIVDPGRSTAAPPLRVEGDLEHGHPLRVAISLLTLLSGGFLFAYFLGAPVLEFLEAGRAALPI